MKTRKVHPLERHPLPEIGPRRRATLEAAGCATLQALAAADPEQLAGLPGMNRPLARRCVSRAAEALEALREVEASSTPGASPARAAPPGVRPLRRRAKQVLERVREARRHVAGATAKKPRKQALASLDALKVQLKSLIRELRDRKSDDAERWRMQRVLRGIDARLAGFLERRPKRTRLQEVRRYVRRATKSLS